MALRAAAVEMVAKREVAVSAAECTEAMQVGHLVTVRQDPLLTTCQPTLQLPLLEFLPAATASGQASAVADRMVSADDETTP